ncbi:hypothetical protein JHW43_003242 [Diplocarpon mali]|nr:hypothetical protein JHW43_003242 [Diplocarpon mali]
MAGNLDTTRPPNSTLHHDDDNPGHHLLIFPQQTISRLAPFSALIISVVLVVYFLIRFYVLENFLLERVYGRTYTQMDETTRRGFVNHHIAGTAKISILIIAAYPFVLVVFGDANFHSAFAGSDVVRMGDILIVAAQMLIAMYVFELFYRPKISPVSVGHHIGTIFIGQAAIAINIDFLAERDGTIEFLLCLVWGAFDIISEFLPHVSIILYRVYPSSHVFLRKVFLVSCITTFTGTILETLVTMYLFGSLWARWTVAFKITTPILHVVFAAAQMWGSWNFYMMYQKQKRLIAQEARPGDAEGGLEAPSAPKKAGQVDVSEIAPGSNAAAAAFEIPPETAS